MPNILIVDDDPSICELLQVALGQRGFSVAIAENGTRALELLLAKTFDLAIIDRRMPEMTGLHLLERIRAHPQLRTLKVLMCTATNLRKDVEDFSRAGADGYIPKPIQMKSLIEKINSLLAQESR